MTGTGATCPPLPVRKPAPFLGPSPPATHLQPAAVAQVTPQALECAAEKRQGGEVGALRRPQEGSKERAHLPWPGSRCGKPGVPERCRAQAALPLLTDQAPALRKSYLSVLRGSFCYRGSRGDILDHLGLVLRDSPVSEATVEYSLPCRA